MNLESFIWICVAIVSGLAFYIGLKYDMLAGNLVKLLKDKFPQEWEKLEKMDYSRTLVGGIGKYRYGNVFRQFKVIKYINNSLPNQNSVLDLTSSMSRLLAVTLYAMFGGLVILIVGLLLIIR